jgi:para-aminobenzoate synthetase component II
MPRVLVLDNHDSFTYNLVQYLEVLGAACDVVYSDALRVEEALGRPADAVLISPGPGGPKEAGVSVELIRRTAGARPILGVCLGHQAVGHAFGGKVVRAGRIMHGKTSPIEHDGRTLFAGLDAPFTATRYHSLLVERQGLPACLEISAWTAEQEIMGLRHRELPIEGVQFHPESILSTSGMALLRNWVRSIGGGGAHE